MRSFQYTLLCCLRCAQLISQLALQLRLLTPFCGRARLLKTAPPESVEQRGGAESSWRHGTQRRVDTKHSRQDVRYPRPCSACCKQVLRVRSKLCCGASHEAIRTAVDFEGVGAVCSRHAASSMLADCAYARGIMRAFASIDDCTTFASLQLSVRISSNCFQLTLGAANKTSVAP